jgi:hypothetical protein
MTKTVTIISSALCTLLINDRTYKTDKNGVLYIDIDELLVGGDKNLFEFDREVDLILNKSQKIRLYEILLKYNQFGTIDIQKFLAIDKTIAHSVLILAAQHNLLVKYYTQWKLASHEIKTQIKIFINAYQISQKNKHDLLDSSEIIHTSQEELHVTNTQTIPKKRRK